MVTIDRRDNSVLGNWWWTIDRWNFFALALLGLFGFIMSFLASQAVAKRISLDATALIGKQGLFLLLGWSCLFLVSLATPQQVKRLGVILFVISIVLVIITLEFAKPIKGASRWISLFGVTIQPSEILKPGFAILSAWLLSIPSSGGGDIPTKYVVGLAYITSLGLLLLQPDFGQSVVLSLIIAAQIVLLGIPIIYVLAMPLFLALGVAGAYYSLDHVRSRIQGFLTNQAGDNSQLDWSLKAFSNGHWFGMGPGEGIAKRHLPDAHTDFVFAVIAEEFGLIAILILITVFAAIIIRATILINRQRDLFTLLAGGGLLAQFGSQILINMSSTLGLIPPKGMALPFISYGGSSLMASSIAMGCLLALTRRRRTSSQFEANSEIHLYKNISI